MAQGRHEHLETSSIIGSSPQSSRSASTSSPIGTRLAKPSRSSQAGERDPDYGFTCGDAAAPVKVVI